MDVNNNKDLNNFTNILNSWKNIYQHIIVSYLVLKTDIGEKVLYGRIIFAYDLQHNIKNFKFETDHISAAHYITKANEATIDCYIQKAKTGEILYLDSDKKLTLGQDSNISIYFIPPLSSLEMKLPSIKFSGISRYNLMSKTVDLRKLDAELKSAQQPFDSLDELLLYSGLPSLNQMGDTTAIEIVAISPAFIKNDSKLDKNKAVIKCLVAQNVDKAELRLGFRIFKEKQIERGSEIGTTFSWKKEKKSIMGTLKMPIKNSTLLQTYLSYQGICIDQFWITDPSKLLNPRQSIHETMEKDLESVRTNLTDFDVGNVSNFEPAVTVLLHLLGFSVVNYGKIRRLLDGPDIVAFTPQGNITVIECTVGLLNSKDKLAKLVHRTNLIRTKMQKSDFRHLEIQSVIVTMLSGEEIKADFELAAKHSIAVISKEIIEELLKKVAMPLDTEKLFKELKTFIPKKPPMPGSIQSLSQAK